jgi:hypothetical protein
MRRLAPFMLAAAMSLQGCVVYSDACEGCDWREGRPGGESTLGGVEDISSGGVDAGQGQNSDAADEPGESTVPEEEPVVYSAAFVPGQAEQGETFVARLYLQGAISIDDVASVTLSSGVRVAFFEVRDGSIVVLVDVAMSVPTGAADLIVTRKDGSIVVFAAMLMVGEPGSGMSAVDCQ